MVSYLNTNRRRGSAIDRLTLEEQLINLLCGPLILMQLLRILVPVPLSDIFKENYPTSLVLPQRTQCTMYIVGKKDLLIFFILGYSADFERVSLEAPSVGGMKILLLRTIVEIVIGVTLIHRAIGGMEIALCLCV